MAAVFDAASHTVGASVAPSLEAEPLPIDVEITIFGSFDPVTEELVENARSAAALLRDLYGVDAIVVPSLALTPPVWGAGPSLFVNGYEVPVEDKVPSPEEIVEHVLRLLGMEPREPVPLSLSSKREDKSEAVAAAW